MSGSLIAVTVTAAAALLALGGIGATAVAGMSRGAEETGNVYGALMLSFIAVFVMALLSFGATYLIR